MSQQSVIITDGLTDVVAKAINIDGSEQGLVTRPVISGVDADGYTPTVNPLLVGGVNGDGYVQTLSISPDGYLNVNATVTTPPDLDAGTPGSPVPVEAEYVAGRDPSGNLQPFQMTADGYLKVEIQETSPIDVNVTNTVNVDLTNVSAPDGAVAPTETVQVGGKDINGNIQALSVGTDGYLNVNATVTTPPDLDAGTPGQPVPVEAEFVAAQDPSGNLQPLLTNADGYLYVAVDGNQAIDVSVTNTVLVDLSLNSAVDGTTAPPETLQVGGKDSDGYIQTLSVGSDGYLNVNAVVTTPPDLDAGTPGQPVPAEAEYVAGRDPSGNLQPLQMTADGYLKVEVQNSGADIDVNVTNTVNVDLVNVSAPDGTTAPAETVQVGGKDASGNIQTLATDGYGVLQVHEGAAVAYKYENAANQTVTLKVGAGVIRRVIVGNAGQTAALITFYDNTAGSGTVIAKVNPSNVLGTLEFDIAFTTGLTYTTNNKTPGDVTITFE